MEKKMAISAAVFRWKPDELHLMQLLAKQKSCVLKQTKYKTARRKRLIVADVKKNKINKYINNWQPYRPVRLELVPALAAAYQSWTRISPDQVR